MAKNGNGPTTSKRPQARPQYLRGSKNPGRPQYLTGSKTTGTPRKTDEPRKYFTGTKKPKPIQMRPVKPPVVKRSTSFTDRRVKSRSTNE